MYIFLELKLLFNSSLFGASCQKNRSCIVSVVAVSVLICIVSSFDVNAEEPYDLVIKNGRLIDGTGNPWYSGDIAIRGGRIVDVGKVIGASKETLDAKGRYLSPGFIDIHSHASAGLVSNDAKRRAAPNLVSQGITTVVLNPDGSSTHPLSKQKTQLQARPLGVNAALMVGHNTIRSIVLGPSNRREARSDEIKKMRELIEEGMELGAYGLTAGLEYIPGIWSTTEELIDLNRTVKNFGGVFLVHERASGADPFWYYPSQHNPAQPNMIDNILELIRVGEETGVTVVATHIKARGSHFWGSSRVMIRLINEARQRGVSIYADQYPYTSSGSDGRLVLIPLWLRQQLAKDHPKLTPAERLERALANEKLKKAVLGDVKHMIRRRGGATNIIIMDHPDKAFVGKTLSELAKQHNTSPTQMSIKLQLEGDRKRPGGARIRAFSMSEVDVEAFAAEPWVATATDAGIALPSDGPVHARFYGTFPRKLRRYALRKKVLSLEDAVRSSTSLPAQIIGFQDRGLLKPGYHADVVMFDMNTLKDIATFDRPHQFSQGVTHVLVGGRFVVKDSKLTGGLFGRLLLRK